MISSGWKARTVRFAGETRTSNVTKASRYSRRRMVTPNSENQKESKKQMNMIQKVTLAAVACSAWSMAAPVSGQVTSISPGSTYYIKNAFSGLVLNQGGSTTNGSPITQWSQTTSPN